MNLIGCTAIYDGLNYHMRQGQVVKIIRANGGNNYELKFLVDGFVHPSCGTACLLDIKKPAELTVNKLGNFPRKKEA